MRAFLSYDIDDQNLRSRIISLQKELMATGCDMKMVQPEILHFTVKFFGEIDQSQANTIISSLEGKVEGFEREVYFRGIGVFPNERRVSVIWIGSDEASALKLTEQAKKINELLALIRTLPREDPERFNPHVTIARVRSARNKETLLQLIQSNRNTEFGSTTIRNLRLKLSELAPSGPKYSDLHIFG